MCVASGGALLLADYECEVKYKFVIIVHFKEEAWYRRRLGILGLCMIRCLFGFR